MIGDGRGYLRRGGHMGLFDELLGGRKDGVRAWLRRRVAGGHAVAPDGTVSPTTSSRLEPPRDVTPPDGFEVVLHRDALAPGQLTEVIVGGRAVAVGRLHDGAFVAVGASCPHAGGPIADGDIAGHEVTCPYHAWRFDLRTGACAILGEEGLPTYDVELVGEAVCVRV